MVKVTLVKKIEKISEHPRLSHKDIEKKLKIEYEPSNEEREIELTLKSIELGRKRTQDLEKLIQESVQK
ncbi:MAG: hypothetical protein ACTSYI_06325 [Promethearchaeota archaeon]